MGKRDSASQLHEKRIDAKRARRSLLDARAASRASAPLRLAPRMAFVVSESEKGGYAICIDAQGDVSPFRKG